MIPDVTINGVSMRSLGWLRETVDFPAPQSQSSTIVVPGRNSPIRFTEALGRVSTSEITYAARDSDFDGFAIKQGDYLALVEHQLFGTDQDLTALLERLARSDASQQAEFISIFYGVDVSEEDAQKALALFQAACPNAEITLLSGGQPVYYYMISAE